MLSVMLVLLLLAGYVGVAAVVAEAEAEAEAGIVTVAMIRTMLLEALHEPAPPVRVPIMFPVHSKLPCVLFTIQKFLLRLCFYVVPCFSG